jgi:geranylgeranyl diphosphate synthase type I
VEALATYGLEVGLAFQIRDDVLGIWGESGTTGKPAGDLRRRKKTLPSLYALSRAGDEDKAHLRHLFAVEEPSETDVAEALAALERTGARAHCEKMVARYSAAARGRLAALPPSDARAALDALVAQLEVRAF